MQAAHFEATRLPSFQGICAWDTSATPELWEMRNNQSSGEMFGRGRAGQVSSILGVTRCILIFQPWRIIWTKTALAFNHTGSLHVAAGSVGLPGVHVLASAIQLGAGRQSRFQARPSNRRPRVSLPSLATDVQIWPFSWPRLEL